MTAQSHWEKVYRENDPTTDVSWYQSHPSKSLELILATRVDRNAALIDVGGGASSLVDYLLAAGFLNISVLDISNAAMEYARERLNARASSVKWLHADATDFEPPHHYALWHDRAVFHFLTESEDRQKYVQTLRRALLPGGHLVLGTFAEDGPVQCSGQPVVRYGAKSISAELGPGFRLIDNQQETHLTPWKTEQKFNWFRFQRKLGDLDLMKAHSDLKPDEKPMLAG
jgi:ubiquinone/menaquinone biosynthesis C-methylase UbiE